MNQEKLNDVLKRLRTPLENYSIGELDGLQGDLLKLVLYADEDCRTADRLALELERVCSKRDEKAFDHFRSNMAKESLEESLENYGLK
jgi:hypothetical protein